MYNYNCPDCNEAKLQSDKNARKINEVIDQVNALIQVNNETVDFIEEKANEVVGEIAEIKVNENISDLKTEIDEINSSLDNIVTNFENVDMPLTELVFKIGLNNLSPNIDYKGENITIPSNTIINGNNSTIHIKGVISVGENVNIKNVNFIFDGIINRDIHGVCTSEDGFYIKVKDNDNFYIENCVLDGGTIELNNVKNFKINKCLINGANCVVGTIQTFNNCQYGIIEDNVIKGGKTNGIGLRSSQKIKVLNNNIHNNGHSGIYTPYCYDIDIINNYVYDHYNHDGIDANFSADNMLRNENFNCRIKDNRCWNNKMTGIYVVGSGVEISGNELLYNGANGLRCSRWKQDDTTLQNNLKIFDNKIANNNNALNTGTFSHNVLLDGIEKSIIQNNFIIQDNPNTNVEYNLYIVSNVSYILDNYTKNKMDNPNEINVIGNNNIVRNIGE